MSDLFRKTSLEKLSSPEQLDKMIVITPPSFWIALAGAALMIVTALIWSVFGRLPINVETQGIYINEGGTFSMFSETAGIISKVAVAEGDTVEPGSVIAYVDSADIEKKLEEYASRIELVKAVTMDSESDAVTADNKSLIDIKDQMLTVDQNLLQSQATLELRMGDLAEVRQRAAAAEKAMLEAEAAYYASLQTADSTKEQLAYSEAQSNLANAASYLESSYASLDQANVAYTQASGQYNRIWSSYNQLAVQKEILETAVTDKGEELKAYCEANGLEGTTDPSAVQSLLESGALDGLPEAKSLAEAYLEAISSYQAFESTNAEAMAEYQNYLAQYQLEMESAEATRNNYQTAVNTYTERKEKAGKNYNEALKAYQNKAAELNQLQGQQTKSSNQYNLALSEYQTQQSALTNLMDTVEQLEVQVKTDRELVERQTRVVQNQFEATKASIVDQLQMEYKQYQEQLNKCTIVSAVSGRISEVAAEGSVVNQGSLVAKVWQGEEQENIIVCYVPLNSGKKIRSGMQVLIYPTTVNKQEYGHMEATVESVDSFVTSAENLQTQLGNDSLVEAFLKEGPVIAVICRLRPDAGTASGYYWSGSKGAALEIAEGTLVEASVVVEEKTPISMLIPYIKEKLTVQAGN